MRNLLKRNSNPKARPLPQQTMEFNFIQISDLHLFADKQKKLNGITTYKSLNTIINHINQQKMEYDFVLISGDITESGEEQAYENACSLLKTLGKPFFWIPGNHDKKTTMKGFSEKNALSIESAFIHKNWQFIFLDSSVLGKSYGQISGTSLQLLKRRLQEYSNPTIIALHHNPLPTNTVWADKIMLQKSENFLQIIQSKPQVKAVLYGHIHQPYEIFKQNIKFFSAPSTCFHIQHGLPNFEIDTAAPGYFEFNIRANDVTAFLRRVNIEENPVKDY